MAHGKTNHKKGGRQRKAQQPATIELNADAPVQENGLRESAITELTPSSAATLRALPPETSRPISPAVVEVPPTIPLKVSAKLWLKRTWRKISVVGAVSFAISLAAFWPRLTVTLDNTNPTNLFSSRILVVNQTPMVPLHVETVAVGLCQAVTEGELDSFHSCAEGRFFAITTPEMENFWLESDASAGYPLNKIINLGPGAQLTGADIAIQVTYRWWVIPWPLHKAFRYVTRWNGVHQLEWYPRSFDD